MQKTFTSNRCSFLRIIDSERHGMGRQSPHLPTRQEVMHLCQCLQILQQVQGAEFLWNGMLLTLTNMHANL